MGYRKLWGEKIFDGRKFVEGQVLIVDEKEKVVHLIPLSDAGDNIEQYKGIISPGLINCHCHLELSHMKGRIPEKSGLVDFVFKVVSDRHHDEEEILRAIGEGEDEMIGNGIVAVGDICNNILTIPQKRKEEFLTTILLKQADGFPH